MTKREAVVIETYTGVCMLAGDDRGIAYKYAEELLGFPVYTHMFADKEIQAKLKEQSKPEFLEICKNAKTGGWIQCSKRLPEEHGRYLVSYGKDTRVFIEEWDGYCFSERNYIGQPKAWMELPGEYDGE